MERSLRLEHFRNIGFNEPPKKPYERLVLNRSLIKSELGDLVILVGANNSGKSNVLDALNIIANDNISERDITDLFMEDEYRTPKITLVCHTDDEQGSFYFNKTLGDTNNTPKQQIYIVNKSGNVSEQQNYDYEKQNSIHNEKFGYDFLPKITIYQSRDIFNKELISNVSNIAQNKFLMSVLKSIDTDVSTIHNAYNMFRTRGNIGVLNQESKKINRKLEEVTDKFNQLYFADSSQYTFELSLQKDEISFVLFRDENSIFLDYQSVGFRWFFNLFFNLLCSNNIQAGDIIIMDEPATNLHVKGQKELRKFLKDFAVHNDITIVLATHSPFLIDLDYLDELRIIKNNDNITSIDNDFTAVNRDDSDSLLAVKEALTIENHIIMNPDKKLIFVEGITDYNYLTAFKHLLGKNDFYFLPINGVGTNDDEHKKSISKTLLNIRRDATLLVDGDKAGIAMQKINENSDLNVITLSDIDKKFSGKSIESLFTHDDLEAFGLLNKDGSIIKYNSTSSIFKKKVVNDIQKVSDETLDNFKKLFDTLEEKTN